MHWRCVDNDVRTFVVMAGRNYIRLFFNDYEVPAADFNNSYQALFLCPLKKFFEECALAELAITAIRRCFRYRQRYS